MALLALRFAFQITSCGHMSFIMNCQKCLQTLCASLAATSEAALSSALCPVHDGICSCEATEDGASKIGLPAEVSTRSQAQGGIPETGLLQDSRLKSTAPPLCMQVDRLQLLTCTQQNPNCKAGPLAGGILNTMPDSRETELKVIDWHEAGKLWMTGVDAR